MIANNGSAPPMPPVPGTIYQGDCLEVMRAWPDACADHCIADPPFGISGGSGRGSKAGLRWAFSSHVTIQEQWDRLSGDQFFEFNVAWLKEVCRLVKPNGNIFVFGTFHNIYQLGFILQNILKRRIINSIIWYKPNAQPNITARMLTESTEQIIWAANETPQRAKGWTFNYWKAKEQAGGKQMRNLWEFPCTPASERVHGKHPSQKPLALYERLISVATNEGDLLIDPFAGAGTLALAARRLGRRWLLIESMTEYVELARRRLEETSSPRSAKPVGSLKRA